MNDFFKSLGLKRKIAAWLNVILGIISPLVVGVPALQPIIDALKVAIEALGGVAIVQAGASGTLSKYVLLTLSSLIGTILLLSHVVILPAGLIVILTKLQIILAALGAGATLSGTCPDALNLWVKQRKRELYD